MTQRGEFMNRERDGAQAFERMRGLMRELESEFERMEGLGQAESLPAALTEHRLEQVLDFAAAFLNPPSVLGAVDRALVALLRLTGSRRGFLSLKDLDRDAFERVEEELLPATRRRVERMARAVIGRTKDGLPLAIANPTLDAELDDIAEGHPIGPLACVPIDSTGANGAVYLERDTAAAPFQASDLRMVAVLCRFLGEALPVARAAEDLRDSKLQLSLLNRLYESLSQSLELDQVLDLITQVTLEVTEAERAFILLMAGTQLYFGAARDANGALSQQATRDISRSVCNKVVETGEGVYVYDMADSSEFAKTRSVVSLKINSVIAVPLRSQAGLTGVLYVDSRSKLLTALAQKLSVLTTVSHVASLAVESAKLYRQATIDGLSGMYVRTFFMLRLEEEIRRSLRYTRTFSLLIMDIDFFKTVNDTHGHQIGDDVIQAVAAGIKRSIRGGVDMPGRYGGDEMVLLLPETHLEGTLIVAERIRAFIANTPVPLPNGGTCNITVSIGVASFPSAGESATLLFAHADLALYAAKSAGRNCVRVYEAV